MIIAITLCAVALTGVLLWALFTVSRLIQHEYLFHREAWESDGRPIGYMWRPPEASWFRSQFAFHRCALAWPLSTPDWILGDTAAEVLLSRLRWLVLIWNIGAILLFLWAYVVLIA
jgi:hypothetical protein